MARLTAKQHLGEAVVLVLGVPAIILGWFALILLGGAFVWLVTLALGFVIQLLSGGLE